MNIHAFSMALWVIVLLFCLEIFAKSMHLLQTLFYWLCIYTYLTFVTLHCISSWFISSAVQWSGLSDKYIVCWYTCLGVLSELSLISLICVTILVKCAMSWFLAICVLDFFLINVYRFMILCSEGYTGMWLLNGFWCQVLGYHAP